MCTKEEVRQVIRSEAPSKIPTVLLNVGVFGIITLTSWMLYTIHQQDKLLMDAKSSQQIALAMLAGKVELLGNGLKNIKEVSISRSKDLYTGSQAKSDRAYFNERCDASNRRHDESQKRQDRIADRLKVLDSIVRKYHNKAGLL